MKPAVFHVLAKKELCEAVAWYERRKSGLGREFLLAVEKTVQRIQKDSQLGSRYGTTKFHYVLVRRFPYAVFYSEDSHQIRIAAVAHGSRRPGYWINRD